MSYADDEGGDPGRRPVSFLPLHKVPGAALREAPQMPGSDTCRRRSSQQPKSRNNHDLHQLANQWTKHSLSAPWMPSSHKGTHCHAQQRGQTLKLNAKWKESHTSGRMHHGFIYTRCSKYANYKQKIGGRLSGALGWNRGVHGERGRGALLGRGTCWTLTCGNSHATQHVYQRCLKCRFEAGELQSMYTFTKDAWNAGLRQVSSRVCTRLPKMPEMQAWGRRAPEYVKYTSIQLTKETNLLNKLLCLQEAGVVQRR